MESGSFPVHITTNIAGYKYTVNATSDTTIKQLKEMLVSHSDWDGWAYSDVNLMHVPGGFFNDEPTCADYDIKRDTELTCARSGYCLAMSGVKAAGKIGKLYLTGDPS